MRSRDPLGYYSALNISPEASAAEIRLAYEFLKKSYHTERKQLDIGKIRAAHKTLGDPRSRKAYDNGNTRRERPAIRRRPQRVPVRSLTVALILLVVSSTVLLMLVGPELRARLVDFDAGEQLYWATTGQEIGTVVAFEQHHAFPSGTVVPAFQIRPADGEELVWYPARDLKRHARTR